MDSVVSRSRRQRLIYSNLRKIQMRIKGLNLLEAVLKPFIVISATEIYEQLRGLVVIFGVSSSRLHLFKEGRQLFLYFLPCFLLTLSLKTLLLQLTLQVFYLLVERANGTLVLFFLVCQVLYALMQASNYSLFSNAPILQSFHTHQRLQGTIAVSY